MIKFIIHLKDNDLIEIKNPKTLFEVKNGKSKLLNLEEYDLDNKLKKVSRVLFVLDCDLEENDRKCGGCEKTEQCLLKIENEFKKRDKEVEHFLFDKNLEEFILNSLDEKSRTCLNDLKDCFNLEDRSKHKKALVCVYKGIYPEKPFDFNHPNFDELRKKILWLLRS
ncbi:hypothetical protein [Caminibacter sp.]